MTVSFDIALAQEAMPRGPEAGLRKLRILILEDDAADRLLLRRVINRSEFDADIVDVEDIASFREALRDPGFDLVIIDYYLGFETGLDALQLLAAEPGQDRAVPIMLSRAKEPQVIVQAMHAGCADYLVKDSLDVESLRYAIGAAVERRILLAAMRENQDLRRAIRRLVERLSNGRIPGLAEPQTPFQHKPAQMSDAVSNRLSLGLLADLELLWHMRRD